MKVIKRMAEPAATLTDQQGNNSLIEELYEWAGTISYSIAIVVLMFSLIFRIMGVSGISMENTLNQGVQEESQTQDRVVISDLNYTPRQGDIVAIHKKIGDISLIVKRVIAVENQKVSFNFDRHIVYVDGKVLKEPYIKDRTVNDVNYMHFPITVPKNCVFVMGDNRGLGNSYDSRYFGCINKKSIIGKAYFRILPINRIGFLS